MSNLSSKTKWLFVAIPSGFINSSLQLRHWFPGSVKTSRLLPGNFPSISVTVIVLAFILFPIFYLLSLAGGDLEWIKKNLSYLGICMVLSILFLTMCIFTILTSQILTMKQRRILLMLIIMILLTLKYMDRGETFQSHGSYNMLIFLVICVPLNVTMCLIIYVRNGLQAKAFRLCMGSTVVLLVILIVGQLHYYITLWGLGVKGKGLREDLHFCEWKGQVGGNIPYIDLLPNGVQNVWAGVWSCPETRDGFSSATFNSTNGLLTIICANSQEDPSYNVLPDTKGFNVSDKVEGVFHKKINERLSHQSYSGPVKLENNVEAVIAQCGQSTKLLLRVSESLRETDTEVSENKPNINVLVIFLDAVSRRQFSRKLEKTESVLHNLANGIELHQFFRYHSVGFNTGDNTRALYTGVKDEPKKKNAKDTRMPIWKQYYDSGFVTSRIENGCEDWSSTYLKVDSSFYLDHELQAPFCLPPYYANDGSNPLGNFVGPYSIVQRCLHGENVHTHALEYARQFMKIYGKRPWFQIVSLIEGHEGTGEVLLSLDQDLAHFINEMEVSGVLNETVVFILSDHGLHMGINFLFTQNGRIEHMNPYLSLIVPAFFRKEYPHLVEGLEHNEQSLITAYEIYETFKYFANGLEKNETFDINKGTLFDKTINPGRNCGDANIPEKLCQCF